MNRNAPPSIRPGRLRRLLATLAERWSGQLTQADLPPRSPVEASHWEPESSVDELREVPLPRCTAPAKGDRQVGRLAEPASR